MDVNYQLIESLLNDLVAWLQNNTWKLTNACMSRLKQSVTHNSHQVVNIESEIYTKADNFNSLRS